MSRIVKSALIQCSTPVTEGSIDEIRDAMTEKHLGYIDAAGKQGVQILGLQEIFNGPYFCPSQDPFWYGLAEACPGPTTELMAEYAKKYNMVMVVPIYEREMAGVYYNTAAVIDADGRYLGKFRKVHIPKVGKFDEKYYFADGNLGFPVFDTVVGKLGVYICYDRHFPEGWRELALNGVELVFNPSATFRGLSDHIWTLEQPGAAIANGIFIGANNRVGTEAAIGNHYFYGSSYFTDPRGNVLNQGPDDSDALVVSDLDFAMIREVRDQWQFYRDRRPETYINAARRT